MQNFNPNRLSISYYHEKGNETIDLNAMYLEIGKLHQEVPKAMAEIHDAPPDHYDFMLEL